MCQSTGGVRELGGVESINFAGDDVGIERWPRALAAASFTAGGIETLSVSREAGQPLIPNQGKIGAVFEAVSQKSVKIC
jgi:hypothetical protein